MYYKALLLVGMCTLSAPLLVDNALSQSVGDFYECFEMNNILSEVVSPISLVIEDDRMYQDYKVDYDDVEQEIVKSIRDKGFEIVDDHYDYQHLDVYVRLGFLGLYQTSGRNWGTRSVVDVEIYNFSGDEILIERANTDETIGHRGRLRSRDRSEYKSKILSISSKSVIEIISDAIELSGAKARDVLSSGVAKKKDGQTTQDTIKSATLNALRSGAAAAWGINLESVTEMIDLGDVTERTRASAHGHVREHDVLKTFESEDGSSYCVVVRSTILQEM